VPMIERVTDVPGERRAAGDHRQLLLEPGFKASTMGSECSLRAAT
jgi:hypothetical protein